MSQKDWHYTGELECPARVPGRPGVASPKSCDIRPALHPGARRFARRLHTPGMRPPRALRAGRITALGVNRTSETRHSPCEGSGQTLAVSASSSPSERRGCGPELPTGLPDYYLVVQNGPPRVSWASSSSSRRAPL